ncbi:DUF1707 SHOCT-like domain-containing protein [Actinoallomurus soli]|uniref:DUF1707 SHOCT-like domain-containing protein n=1 Tax=Actinoallomurus soli TaxID=2952535 RepID=UPI0027E36C9E|nr:DUF1707 domain-containing protein [Actinoallomurus soli]
MDVPDKPVEVDPRLMRASDADRDRIADQLREALAEGRLTAEEHAERLDIVYQAKTYAELAPVVADLPGAGAPAPAAPQPVRHDLPAPQAGSPNLVAILSGAERKGRWLVEPHTNVVTVLGGVELDLRQAVLAQREVTINITAVLGGVSITVPPGVRVLNSVTSVMGGCSLPSDDTVGPDAPVIRLTGMALLGGIDVKRLNADATTDSAAIVGRDFHARQRSLHREFREKQRAVHREFREQQRELRRQRRTR